MLNSEFSNISVTKGNLFDFNSDISRINNNLNRDMEKKVLFSDKLRNISNNDDEK